MEVVKLKKVLCIPVLLLWLLCAIFAVNIIKVLQFTRLGNVFEIEKVRMSESCQSFTQVEKMKLESGFQNQLHPRLLQLIQCDWIHPPSSRKLHLNGPKRVHFSQWGQSVVLDRILGRPYGNYKLVLC